MSLETKEVASEERIERKVASKKEKRKKSRKKCVRSWVQSCEKSNAKSNAKSQVKKAIKMNIHLNFDNKTISMGLFRYLANYMPEEADRKSISRLMNKKKLAYHDANQLIQGLLSAMIMEDGDDEEREEIEITPQREIQSHRIKHKLQRGKNNPKLKHLQPKGHKRDPRGLTDQISAMSANSIGMATANSERNAAKNTQSFARNLSNMGYCETTRVAVTVSAENYTQMCAEPHSEQRNVKEKSADSSKSEVQKTHSNPTLRVDGARERKKDGEKNPERLDKVLGERLREEKKQKLRTRFFSKANKP